MSSSSFIDNKKKYGLGAVQTADILSAVFRVRSALV